MDHYGGGGRIGHCARDVLTPKTEHRQQARNRKTDPHGFTQPNTSWLVYHYNRVCVCAYTRFPKLSSVDFFLSETSTECEWKLLLVETLFSNPHNSRWWFSSENFLRNDELEDKTKAMQGSLQLHFFVCRCFVCALNDVIKIRYIRYFFL